MVHFWKFVLMALIVASPSAIIGGLVYLYLTRKPKKKGTFLGIENMEKIIRTQKNYPGAFIPIVKVSRRERRKQERKNKFTGNDNKK